MNIIVVIKADDIFTKTISPNQNGKRGYHMIPISAPKPSLILDKVL